MLENDQTLSLITLQFISVYDGFIKIFIYRYLILSIVGISNLCWNFRKFNAKTLSVYVYGTNMPNLRYLGRCAQGLLDNPVTVRDKSNWNKSLRRSSDSLMWVMLCHCEFRQLYKPHNYWNNGTEHIVILYYGFFNLLQSKPQIWKKIINAVSHFIQNCNWLFSMARWSVNRLG